MSVLFKAFSSNVDDPPLRSEEEIVAELLSLAAQQRAIGERIEAAVAELVKARGSGVAAAAAAVHPQPQPRRVKKSGLRTVAVSVLPLSSFSVDVEPLLTAVAASARATVRVVWRDVGESGGALPLRLFLYVPDMGRFSAAACLMRLAAHGAVLSCAVPTDDSASLPTDAVSRSALEFTAHDHQLVLALATTPASGWPTRVGGVPVLVCQVDPSTTKLIVSESLVASLASLVSERK